MNNKQHDSEWEKQGLTKAEWLANERFDRVGYICPNCGSELFELAEDIDDSCFHVWRECPSCDWSGDHYDC